MAVAAIGRQSLQRFCGVVAVRDCTVIAAQLCSRSSLLLSPHERQICGIRSDIGPVLPRGKNRSRGALSVGTCRLRLSTATRYSRLARPFSAMASFRSSSSYFCCRDHRDRTRSNCYETRQQPMARDEAAAKVQAWNGHGTCRQSGAKRGGGRGRDTLLLLPWRLRQMHSRRTGVSMIPVLFAASVLEGHGRVCVLCWRTRRS